MSTEKTNSLVTRNRLICYLNMHKIGRNTHHYCIHEQRFTKSPSPDRKSSFKIHSFHASATKPMHQTKRRKGMHERSISETNTSSRCKFQNKIMASVSIKDRTTQNKSDILRLFVYAFPSFPSDGQYAQRRLLPMHSSVEKCIRNR
eukprot:TRINITY_DN5603_c0_g1_i1.p1 TRINITY_DN5603_c0_g1~~TRINITY_DN5603_c0_g1_i1.p1  ORF type:complete len:146 (+),score=22.57 TRINITY_DN5603_c0_g1_i1:393-830(+)